MDVMIIKPPRKLWPYLNEDDNFLLPQALPCLGAVLREEGINVRLLDCSPLKIGWNSLERIIKKEKPKIICISEPETMWSVEGIKLAEMVRKTLPSACIVAGGAHFSLTAEESLKNSKIDIIVEGEGELTIVELAHKLLKKKDFSKVKGIYYKKNQKVLYGGPRALINDLDSLPLPAYDLMPMDKYGKSNYLFHPGGATIHHSRGCPFNCDFCVCWKQMSDKTSKKECPRWRTKSVDRTIEEIKILYYKYRKKGLVFTDDNWNFDPAWNKEFAEKIIKEKLKINWFAFMRADHVVRDERMGILRWLVKAGLAHVSIGVEREEDNDVQSLNKSVKKSQTKKAFDIFRKKYPSVFTQGTFIIGTRDETVHSIKKLSRYIQKELKIDYPSFSPLTPIPGTEVFKNADKKGLIEIKDFELYDWYTPIMSSKNMSRQEIEKWMYWLNKKNFSLFRFINKMIFSSKYKRKIYTWFLIVSLRIFKDKIKYSIGLRSCYKFDEINPLVNLYYPDWYDN